MMVTPRRVVAAAAAAVAIAALAAGAHALRPAERASGPGVVSVLVSGASGVGDTATGFLVSPTRVVTVAHVLDSAEGVTLRGSGRGWTTARVLRVDRRNDLALLAVADAHFTPIRTPSARRTRLLSASEGGPRVLTAAVRRRIAASVRDPAAGSVSARSALELAADVQAGDSGAPLVGTDGRVLGVLFARSERRPGTAYAVDRAAVTRLLTRAGG